ncbi:beta-lactamase [Lipomyces tetrasporus]
MSTSTVDLEDIFRAAVENNIIPGVVLVATNKSGTLNYAKAFGKTGASSTSAPLTLNSTFWLASCTKLMTTIASLQCVERGLFSLDSPDDVARLLPEYSVPEILTGFDELGHAVMRSAAKRITLRHLLTHTSGMSYTNMNPKLIAWRKSRGEDSGPFKGEIAAEYRMPLLFEPGVEWEYSVGLDWAGQMVERATGKTLEAYMREHIWGPLGMHSTTFHLEQKEDVRRRLVDVAVRDPDTQIMSPAAGQYMVDPAKDSAGGLGVYSTATDYIEILASLLRDDGRLLRSETTESMFTPQLSDACKDSLMKKLKVKEVNQIFTANTKIGTEFTFGLGSMLTLEDLETGRKKGTLTWGGLPNLFWWIDRETGVCGFYATQVIPPGDLKSTEMYTLFEKEIYKKATALATE